MCKGRDRYLKLLGCDVPDQVWQWVPRWSSDLTEREHLVRSAILEIHASIEERLKFILYEKLSEYIYVDTSDPEGRAKADRQKAALRKHVDRMSFGAVYALLKPCLDSFHEPELSHIRDIQRVRNDVTHEDLGATRYKERSPFDDPECFAQLFFDGFVVRQHLSEFIANRIDDARFEAREHAKFYWRHIGEHLEEDGEQGAAESPPQ